MRTDPSLPHYASLPIEEETPIDTDTCVPCETHRAKETKRSSRHAHFRLFTNAKKGGIAQRENSFPLPSQGEYLNLSWLRQHCDSGAVRLRGEESRCAALKQPEAE